ncbi:hypothetical protein A2U01_0082069, partial [Trifolium medium]|nr:hypothetical protein [Trifolium medium]
PLNEDMAHNSNRVEDPVLQPVLQPVAEIPTVIAEEEVNSNMDEVISGDSEFVGDTQLVNDAQQQLFTAFIQVPDTMQKDIDFLKESWI